MKQRVLNELTSIAMIYEETSKVSIDATVLATFPINQEIYQMFASIRRKRMPSLPNSCLFNIPDLYKLTIDRKRFLLSNESFIRRERLLMLPQSNEPSHCT
ncbi:unnamed protein product [Rotaria sordida]|uniref:Uncharacterized protein n=1 Tax=Rotaria sordida TaxID=392033 RepID=A0A819BB27_9BILA|nr:unnamed protein product [Rotaria sordida]CAF3798059.1 unnamed protein product [Rotaria sordida]